MAENKIEEIIDLLAKYGGFNREYLRDKLLTFANDGRSETKNKMAEVAALFGKKLGEEFWARIVGNKFEIKCRFTASGFQQTVVDGLWHDNDAFLILLLTGEAEIVEDEE